MTSRTLLSIVLGLVCSALAVGGLSWASDRESAAADPALDASVGARAAYGQGLGGAGQPQLRTPAPAPAEEPAVQSAAPEAAPVESAPPARYDDHDEHEDDVAGWGDDDHDEDHGDDEGEDD